jgi:hypothetical protein
MTLSMKFAAVLLLGVSDPDINHAQQVKKFVSAIIPYFRAFIAKTPSLKLDSLQAYDYFPEYMLPYIIFLLAHHPDYDKEQPMFLSFQKYFYTYYFSKTFRILYTYFDEATKGFDNLAFFYQIIAKIKQRKDVLQPNSTVNYTALFINITRIIYYCVIWLC